MAISILLILLVKVTTDGVALVNAQRLPQFYRTMPIYSPTLLPADPMIKAPELVMPYEGYMVNSTQDLEASYIIDNRRYVEAAPTRCYASTILEDPDAVEPAFVIITRTAEVRLNATAPLELVSRSGFDPKKRTTILVHGFTQSYPNTEWLRKTRALFEIHSLVGRQNLIIMDWGTAAQGSYAQVAAMVSGMGSFLANFLMKLLELGTDRASIHIVGHSLGAHLAGFAGKRIRPRIGRITALDPAGPCFGKFFTNSPLDRLSPDDAYQVAVYHYDDDFLGLSGQHGQFDVYVNGGSSQPGCRDNMNTMVNAVVTMLFRRNRVLSESHTRSTEVSSCQLSATGCQQVAYECRDYAAFKMGECGKCDLANNQCFLMSLNFQYGEDPLASSPLRTSFPGKRLYISTGANEPFCSHHYQVLVKFVPSPELGQLARRNKWRVQVELVTDTNERINVTLSNQMAPNIFSYLLLSDAPQPMRIRAAVLQVRASDGNLVPLQVGRLAGGYRVLNLEVNYMSNINPNVRRALSSRLCPLLPLSALDGMNSEQDPMPSTRIQLDECFGPPPT